MSESITYPCKFHRTMQPAMVRPAAASGPRPLLVALHTWSGDCDGHYEGYEELCRKRDWHLIFPNFRGPNWNPDACGSDLVVSDLEDAVAYMRSSYDVDPRRIYLCGGSGGGHCALLMAGRRPDLWSAVSAWCPVSDLVLWYRQRNAKHSEYAKHIELSCGGDPEVSETALREARLRSPVTWLANAAGKLPVDIGTGIHDGHKGSVPVGHAIRAYNELALPGDRIGDADIAYIEEKEQVPAHLEFTGSDPAYGERKIHLRRRSAHVRLTLFEGGHDILPEIAGEWLERQSSGAPPDWRPGRPLDAGAEELYK